MKRRAVLLALGSAAAGPIWAAKAAAHAHSAQTHGRSENRETSLAAAWDDEGQHRVGVLGVKDGRLRVNAQLEVPTRAHGLWREHSGTVLAVARRPGDWLLRWRADGTVQQWAWSEPQRALNGHVLASADGKFLYTTETDLETGAGLLGVRDAATLEKQGEWPTHGTDPHEVVWGPQGGLWVANGGIATLPESGRRKLALASMDSSVVCLNPHNGTLTGQWRLADQRLSLRHLAWNGTTLGVALQAEHDDPQVRHAAPVLAVLRGDTLRAVPAPHALSGYGGDIAAVGDGFAVSCTRADSITVWGAAGDWKESLALPEACALAEVPHGLMAGGRGRTLSLSQPAGVATQLVAVRLDNHWACLADV